MPIYLVSLIYIFSRNQYNFLILINTMLSFIQLCKTASI